MTWNLPDEAATVRLAEQVLVAMRPELAGWTILLSGELGAGKSTFARAFITAAGHTGPVPSPTYTLVEPYQLPGIDIYHVDLYRVSDEEELQYLGWDELDNGLRLVEWPDRAPGLAATADLSIRLNYAGDGRSCDMTPLSERGGKLLRDLIPPNR